MAHSNIVQLLWQTLGQALGINREQSSGKPSGNSEAVSPMYNLGVTCVSHRFTTAGPVSGWLRIMIVLCLCLTTGVGEMWGTITSGTANSTAGSLPTGWTKDGDYNNNAYVKLIASTNYILTEEFCQNGFTSIVLSARTFGGPDASQKVITAEWEETGGSSTVLGTVSPSSNSLGNCTITVSSATNTAIGNNTKGKIRISCKGASSSKGSGVASVTINYTAGSCSGGFSVTVKSPTGEGEYQDIVVTDKTKLFSNDGGNPFSNVVTKYKICTWSPAFNETWTGAYVDCEIPVSNKIMSASVAQLVLPTGKHKYTNKSELPNSGTLYPLFRSGNYYYTEATCPALEVWYWGNGNTGGSTPADESYKPGDEVTVYGNTGSLVKTNYTFTGWNTEMDGSGTHYDAGDVFEMPDNYFSLFAEWCRDLTTLTKGEDFLAEANTITATGATLEWIADGATYYQIAVADNSVWASASYQFMDASATYESKTFSDLEPNTTYYVQIRAKNSCGATHKDYTFNFTTKNAYTITYYKNDGGATYETDTKTEGIDYIISSDKFSRDYFSIKEWRTNADGSGTKYDKGATYSTDSDLELYAVWEPATYSVTKTFSGCTSASMPTSYSYTGVANDFSYTVAASSGKTLPATISITMGGVALTAGTDYTWNSSTGALAISRVITGDLVITISALTFYTVTFSNAAGAAPSAVTQVAEGGTVSIPSASACDDWEFAGWKIGSAQDAVTSDPTGTGTWITSESWPKTDYVPTGNVTAYAVFKKTTGGGAKTTLINSTCEDAEHFTDTDWPITDTYYLNDPSGALRIGKSKGTGSVTTKSLAASVGTSLKVDFDARAYNLDDGGNIVVSVTGCDDQTVAWSTYGGSTSEYTSCSLTFTTTETPFTVTIATSLKRAVLKNIEIYYGGGGTTTWKSDVSCATLDHIAITTNPTKLNYLVGQVFDPTGAVVTAYYDNSTSADITSLVTWTPAGGLSSGTNQTITASYGGQTDSKNILNVYTLTLQKKDETGATISGSLSDAPAVSVSSITTLSAAETGNSYVFKEWQITNGTLGSDADVASNSIATVSGNVTVTAVYWKPIKVKWYVPGGQFGSTAEHPRGWSLAHPSAPTPDDYGCDEKVFYGWTRSSSYSNASTPPELVAAGTAINNDENLYAVFATRTGEGTPPTWIKTALGSISEGTYLMCTTNGKCFTGETDSDHRGLITSTAFSSFGSTINEVAPLGSCELTLTAVTNGFTMYAAGKGYLYCSSSGASNIKWHEEETDYWYYGNDHWRYNGAKNGSGYATAIVSYDNLTFRNYVSPGNSTAAVVFLKKTAEGSPAIYSDFSTSCACSGFSFHTGTGTDNEVKSSNTRTCFTQVESSTTWQIENYTIPEDAKFFVGYMDAFQNSLGTSSRSAVKAFDTDETMYFEYTKTGADGYRPSVGNAVGAVGTLRIWSDNNWDNCHVGFDPNGYIFKLGSNYLAMTGSTTLDADRYKETEVITLASTDISGTFQVNIAAAAPNASTGVASRYTQSKNLTTMGVKSGASTWRATSINSAADANTKGFFRIDLGDGGATNWNAHWVPCLELTFDLQSGAGSIVTTPEYVSVEGDASARTVTIPNTAPTRSGYRFMGWANTAERAAAGTVDYAAGSTHNVVLTENKTVYAVWKPLYTVTYAYAGGSGECAGGSYIAGETVTVCASTPTKTGGYTFDGWSYSPSVTVTTGQFTMPAENVTITATWREAEYDLNHSGSNYTNTEGKAKIKSSDTPLTLNYTCTGTYGFPSTISISGGGKASWTAGTDYTWTVGDSKQAAQLVIASTTISANVTITITMKTRYAVTYHYPVGNIGGTTSSLVHYFVNGEAQTLKTVAGVSCLDFDTHEGWTLLANKITSDATEVSGIIASPYTATADVDLYAMYSYEDAETVGYEKLASDVSAGTYILVADGNGKAYKRWNSSSSYGDTANVTVASSKVSVLGNAREITVSLAGNGQFYMYDAGKASDGSTDTKYLSYNGSSNGLYHSATNSSNNEKWKINNDGYIESVGVSGRVLKYNSSNPRFACYTSGQQAVYLYKKGGKVYNSEPSCAMYSIAITTPSGGTVTTTPTAGTEVAAATSTVTVNVTPDDCKYLSALKYNDGSDHAISIAAAPYTFTMPDHDVTVTATFAAKTVSDIEVHTNSHRLLMLGSSFVGEQIRVTYNSGETEDIDWDDSRLAFTGYDMSTLGEQTVTVTYTGCGTTSTTFAIEIVNGVPITFSDCGVETTTEYDPGDEIDVEGTNGAYACSGWEFVGWSATSVADNSTSFSPVTNFNASTARTLYAVYAHIRLNSSSVAEYKSADRVSELREGARYVIAGWVNSNNESYGMTAMLPTVKETYYLNGTHSNNSGFDYTEVNESSSYRYYSTATLAANAHWQLRGDGTGYWQLYNISAAKYLDLTNFNPESDVNKPGYAQISDSPNGKLVMSDYNDPPYGNDSKIHTRHSTSNDTHSLSWSRTDGRFNQYKNGTAFYLTKDEYFTSNPPCAPKYARFHGSGGMVTGYGGNPTGGNVDVYEATRDAGIKLPTAEFADCNGKAWAFAGWMNAESAASRKPILTTQLLNGGVGSGNIDHDITVNGEEFWAVYSSEGEALTVSGTSSMSISDVSHPNYKSEESTITKGDITYGYINVSNPNSTGLSFKEDAGYLYNKTSLGRINYIRLSHFLNSTTISRVKIYVGHSADAVTTELTSDCRIDLGTGSEATYTYYPPDDYEYMKIVSSGGYFMISTIEVDYGHGAVVYATAPDCSTITLSGEIYVTSKQYQGIMAPTPLTVEAHQLTANADVVLTSNSTDVYFSTDRTKNFAMASANQPKNSVTVQADGSGELETTVYVHYKPSGVGTGAASDVTVYANLDPVDPSVTASHTIHVRNLPEKIVIAAKVGANWYALPANLSGTGSTPDGVQIEVNEATMTATAPNTCSYTIWPVKTVNPESSVYDRYTTNATYSGNAYGERVRFSAVNNSYSGLWANDATDGTKINNSATIDDAGDGGTTDNNNPHYEWKITTTVTDGKWSNTLQTDQTNNQRYLRFNGTAWGMYASGTNNLYLLPVTEVEPFEMQVVEWYPTKVLVKTTSNLSTLTPAVFIDGTEVTTPTISAKDANHYEISGLELADNPTKSLTVQYSVSATIYSCTKAIPIIISRAEKSIIENSALTEPFATLGTEVYNAADLVVRDGAVLTLNGTIAQNEFHDVTIYPTAKISVPSGKKIGVHSLTFFGGIDEIYDGSAYTVNKYGVPQLSLKGQFGTKSVFTIDYVMRVNLDQMYQMSVPYDVNLKDITYWDGTSIAAGTQLYVSAYDGQARANKDMAYAWVWEVNFDGYNADPALSTAQLKQGVGYTISAEPQNGGDDYSILRLPMKSNVAANSTEGAKSVPVVAYANDPSITVTDNHKGWNYLGNPYMAAISGDSKESGESKLTVGYLSQLPSGEWEWVNDTYRYVTKPLDDGTGYTQEKFSEATLLPFKSFFLQIATDGDLSYALASRVDAPARYAQARKREVEFDVVLSDEERQDHTGLLIAEKYTPAYEINADLEKMPGVMAVYTMYGGYNLAYNALSPGDAQGTIPIGYIAPRGGEYTFSLDEKSDLTAVEHVYLTDYEDGMTVDLVEQAYSFTTVAGKNENRFALNAILRADDDTPTDIQAADGNQSADECALKLIYKDKMYILQRGILYDATGKRVNTINK